LQSADDQNLFDYFDPLLSPHAYPNGIQPGERPKVDTSSKREMRAATDEAIEATSPAVGFTSSAATKSTQNEFFDPTISPHEYANGTPDQVIGSHSDTAKRTGILLIDHGSRRPDANQRLLDLAQRYQEFLGQANTIVMAAHMEIATPSIKDGIASLLDAGVDEIICHPYFLSPGRHVQEDIPQLIQEAQQSLNVLIPITTTDALGSNTDLMIQAIDGMVKKASAKIDT
jgi:hypothetical protein